MNRIAQIIINLCYQITPDPDKKLADAAILHICTFHCRHSDLANKPLNTRRVTLHVYEEFQIDRHLIP